MAFPTVGTPTASQQTGNSTTSTVTLPASIAAGDLVIASIAADLGASTMTWPSPWVKLAERVDSAHVHSIGYLIASGGETAVAVTHTTERSNHLAWRITNWHGTTPPEVTAVATGTSAAPNSGSLTPSWGSADTLWMSQIAWDDSAAPTLSTYPTNYALGQGTNVTATSAGSIAGSARTVTAATEDPGAYGLSGSETWTAFTVAVRPAASGSVTATPDVASLTLSPQTPTVTASDNKVATPGVASLAITALTPSINVGVNVVPGVASLTITALTPTVTATANQTATIGLATLAISPKVPTVTASDHKTATPGTASLTATALTPTVTVGNNQVATPGLASLTLTALTPTVTATANVVATPGVTALSISTFAPSISTGAFVLGDATGSVTLEHVALATVGDSSAEAVATVVLLHEATATVS